MGSSHKPHSDHLPQSGAARMLRIEKGREGRHLLDPRAFGDNQHNIGGKLAPGFHSCHVDESLPFHQGKNSNSLTSDSLEDGTQDFVF